MTTITGDGFTLRPWRAEDAEALARHANDEAVSRALSDRFPFPYTRADAEAFVVGPVAREGFAFAIEVDGEAVGGIGQTPGDNEYRIRSQIGYWLGRSLWGRGLMSRIVPVFCDHLLEHSAYERLQAFVLSGNMASARVLEKSGFVLEGVHRRALIKRDEIHDIAMYARLRDKPPFVEPDPEDDDE
ncbi:GNAT family N-acetyltransferase [Dokdonella sp. MW10]|uniref:GNAT family N-acetyltransferase n=1 Tax=Dokdonella sp. MW10 TaxID=2992926 RepID=UPI003F7D7918